MTTISQKMIKVLKSIPNETTPRSEIALYNTKRTITMSGRSDSKYYNSRDSMKDYIQNIITSSFIRKVLYVTVFPTHDFEFIKSILSDNNIEIIIASNENITDQSITLSKIKDINDINLVIMFDVITRLEDFTEIMLDIKNACTSDAKILVSDVDALDYRIQIYEDLFYMIKYIKNKRDNDDIRVKHRDIVNYFSNYHSFEDLAKSMRLLGFYIESPKYVDNRSIYYTVFTNTVELIGSLGIFGINTQYNIRNEDLDKSLHAGLLKIFDEKDQTYFKMIGTFLKIRNISRIRTTLITDEIISNVMLIENILPSLMSNV